MRVQGGAGYHLKSKYSRCFLQFADRFQGEWLRRCTWMFSLKGETNAPIPATSSSSHTSGAPRCAVWCCSVLLSSSYRRRACPCHRSTDRRRTGAAASQRAFYRALDPPWKRAPFFFSSQGCCAPPRLPPSRAMASTDRSAGARELSFFHVTDTVRAGGSDTQTGCVTAVVLDTQTGHIHEDVRFRK